MRAWKSDIIAGFSVFLLALPLCLGISIASDFPPAAGLITAIIGGVIASCIGGCKLSIKGPAAGLIVIALGAVHELGGGDLLLGYERALAVGVIAAIIQIIIALCRRAVIAEMMPPSVIHGMLAAIGIIIVSKQAYVMLGVHTDVSAPLSLIAHLPQSIIHLNPEIFIIGLIAFLIAMFWTKVPKMVIIPATVIILACAIPLSLYFHLGTTHTYSLFGHVFQVGSQYLVNIPHDFIKALHFPDFSAILSFASIKYIIMFALVGSIESLLTVCAVDSMAPKHAPSNLNRDLLAVGTGNLISACLGGLPMISEIVRSKANIDYGAQSARGNFVHGLCILIAVFLLPKAINLIPLSALAALLVVVGIRLASPHAFINSYKVGKDQFLLFSSTCVVTLLTDLLTGVAVGVALKLILHLFRGNRFKHLWKPEINVSNEGKRTIININGSLIFTGYLKLKRLITGAAKPDSIIEINLSKTNFIDHTVQTKIKILKQELGEDKIVLTHENELTPVYKHPLSVKKR